MLKFDYSCRTWIESELRNVKGESENPFVKERESFILFTYILYNTIGHAGRLLIIYFHQPLL